MISLRRLRRKINKSIHQKSRFRAIVRCPGIDVSPGDNSQTCEKGWGICAIDAYCADFSVCFRGWSSNCHLFLRHRLPRRRNQRSPNGTKTSFGNIKCAYAPLCEYCDPSKGFSPIGHTFIPDRAVNLVPSNYGRRISSDRRM